MTITIAIRGDIMSKEKRAGNKEFTLNMLRKMGVQFEMLAGGSVRFRHGERTAYIAPSTGAWSVKGGGQPFEKGRGINNLINYLHTGKNHTYERGRPTYTPSY